VTRYRIDPTRSRLAIDATSSVHPIHSETTGLEGWVELGVDGDGAVDGSVEPAAHVELRVERLRSNNPMEDRELRRRVDLDRYPTISGDLLSMEATGRKGRYLARGDVTFRGVTRPSTDELQLSSDGGDAIRLRGSSVFDIRDFGMKPPKVLLFKVAPEITVTVDVVAEKIVAQKED